MDTNLNMTHANITCTRPLRELGLVTIFWDVNFSSVQNVFSAEGALLDDSFIRRIDKFLKELIWMAQTLRFGREQVPLNG